MLDGWPSLAWSIHKSVLMLTVLLMPFKTYWTASIAQLNEDAEDPPYKSNWSWPRFQEILSDKRKSNGRWISVILPRESLKSTLHIEVLGLVRISVPVFLALATHGANCQWHSFLTCISSFFSLSIYLIVCNAAFPPQCGPRPWGLEVLFCLNITSCWHRLLNLMEHWVPFTCKQ